ncbi:MAG: DUF4114 domain-containing protein [Alphaproteobacteria bacterium]|nr:DUF4114 domain-containing protein [Alphaproteobacteria bacterium]
MRIHHYVLTATMLACAATGFEARAGTVSPIQSDATPLGLSPLADVQLAGSDGEAMDFYKNDLPDLQTTVNTTLNETQAVENLSSLALDPNDLYLTEASDVRVYFIGEGAGYRNTLGIYTGDSSEALTGDAGLIFPDASTSNSYLSPATDDTRTESAPLASGDFVDLGTFEAGTQLNLFLIANGANGGSNTYYTDSALNADGIEHFVVLATADSPYLLIGVEDLYGGGDQDYNDVVIALDIGKTNVKQLISKVVPIPGYLALLLGPIGLWFARRRNNTPNSRECQSC